MRSGVMTKHRMRLLQWFNALFQGLMTGVVDALNLPIDYKA